jgi:hypothetical protein
LTKLLYQHDFKKKIVTYVKDEGANLNAMTTTLKYIMNCEILGMEESVESTYFGHAFSKACQYRTIEKKVYKNLKHISIKSVKSNIQNCITWPKKSRKRKR